MKNIIVFSMLACLSLPLAQANGSSEDIEAIADANDAGVGQMLNEMKDAEKKSSAKKKSHKKRKFKKAMSKEQQEQIIARCKKQMESGEKPALICKKFIRPAPELDIEGVLTEAMKPKAKGSPDYCHKNTDNQEAFERCLEGNPALISSDKKSRKHEIKGNRSPAHLGGDHILTAE